MDPTYPLFPVLTFISFVLVLIPLPWHVQAWNVGTCAYIFWSSAACLVEFINSLIWKSNVVDLAPVWCDISSKLLLGAGVGIPAAGLCISRRLYSISAIKSTVTTHQDKRRAVIIDSCIAFGIPALVMALHYVVQGNRYNILEGVGCWPSIYYTLLAYFLVFVWPTLLGCISFVLSALTLRAFYKRRLEFSQFLSTHSSLSMNRYIRLMMLAVSEMMSTIPISICNLYVSYKGVPLQPWISWDYVHYDFSFVAQIPADAWMADTSYRIGVDMSRWIFPAAALWFFLLFGFGTEARKNYRATFLRVTKLFGYNSSSPGPTRITPQWKSGYNRKISVGSLPVYVPTVAPYVKHPDSFKPLATKSFEIDVEKAAGYSSPSLSNYSPRGQQPSPTVTCVGDDTDEPYGAAVPTFVPFIIRSTNSCTLPASHRPFTLPSVCPIPPRAMQTSRAVQTTRSFDSVCITVETQQHSTIV